MHDHIELFPGSKAERSSRTAIGKVIAILEYLATSSRPVSVNDLAKALNLSRSQAHRIVAMLEKEDMLSRHPISKRVMFGRRFARVACKLLAGSPLKPLWHIVLEDLVRDVGATCNIVVYEGAIGTYFDRIESNWPNSRRFKFGSKVPLHCTACGKLYLASLTDKERKIILDSLNLNRFTNATVTSREALERQIKEIRRDQVGFAYAEFMEGMVAVAVPINDSRGALLATLSVHGSNPPHTAKSIQTKVPRLREAAKHLAEIFESHIERKKLIADE